MTVSEGEVVAWAEDEAAEVPTTLEDARQTNEPVETQRTVPMQICEEGSYGDR